MIVRMKAQRRDKMAAFLVRRSTDLSRTVAGVRCREAVPKPPSGLRGDALEISAEEDVDLDELVKRVE